MKFIGFLTSILLSMTAVGKITNPSLFRVTKPGAGMAPSYLFGTLHAEIEISEFNFDLARMIGVSRLVMTEIALTKEETDHYLQDPYRALWRHDPLPIGNLSPKARQALASLGMPGWMTYRIQNESCSIFAIIHSANSRKLPLDIAVMQTAHAAQVRLVALDTKELRGAAKLRQIRSQRGNTFQCRLEQLLTEESPLRILQDFAEALQAPVEKYRQGLEVDSDGSKEPLVTYRNLAWMKLIAPEVRRGGAFVAVGQSHLFGPKGLIALLKARGFAVQPVSFK